MPQLMPFMWVISVFVGLILLIVLIFMYNYIGYFYFFEFKNEINNIYKIMW